MKEITVLLVDDHQLVRKGFRRILEDDPEIHVIGEAGSGVDAAPWFRIFNPVMQGQKFDTLGAYVRQWVPELAGLPDALVHQPWKASAQQLEAAGVRLGKHYPQPLVEHELARQRALEAYAQTGGAKRLAAFNQGGNA